MRCPYRHLAIDVQHWEVTFQSGKSTYYWTIRLARPYPSKLFPRSWPGVPDLRTKCSARRICRAAASPLDDEPDSSRGFLPERAHGLSDRARALPQREGDPGAGAGVKHEEVALIATNCAASIHGRELDLAPFSLRSLDQTAETKACKDYWSWRGATR